MQDNCPDGYYLMPPFECVLECSGGRIPNSDRKCVKRRPWWIFGIVGGLLLIGAIVFIVWKRKNAIKKASQVDTDAEEIQKLVNKAKAEELKQ